jgi:NAD(P)-dependent dehydrogenase (short-subunit alcohol dehydrogenase family)
MGLESHKADGFGTAYRMSKASLNSYTRSLAAELEPRGIMVDAFHPGWIKTVLGGPDAKSDLEESVETAFFLATRPASNASGFFWRECKVVQ